ncbi:MAG: pilus assembly protein [Deltaproteobacteria bacterium]|nr:pilus assembly protein [Deltaproteobacteria bacterium]
MRRVGDGARECRAGQGRPCRLVGDSSGIAVVEFALVAPVLLMLVLGAIEIGRVLYEQQTLDEAARQTARWATTHGSKSDAPATATTTMDKARELAGTYAGLAGTVTFLPNNAPGSTVVIDLTRDHKFMVPFIPTGMFKIKSKATQTIQN